MPLLNTDDLIKSLAIHKNFVGWKASATSVVQFFTDRFFAAGSWGSASSMASGSGEIPTKSYDGALKFPAVVTPGNELYLAGVQAMKTNAGQIVLVDRLWHGSGYSLSTSSTQTVNSVALTRPDSSGEGTEIWFALPGTMGTAAGSLLVNYTNQDGTSGRQAYWVHRSGVAGGTFQAEKLTLQPNDTGVRSIQSVRWTVAPGASVASTFALMIVRRLATIHCANGGQLYHYGPHSTGMPRIYDTSCLSIFTANSTTTSGDVWVSLKLAEVEP